MTHKFVISCEHCGRELATITTEQDDPATIRQIVTNCLHCNGPCFQSNDIAYRIYAMREGKPYTHTWHDADNAIKMELDEREKGRK